MFDHVGRLELQKPDVSQAGAFRADGDLLYTPGLAFDTEEREVGVARGPGKEESALAAPYVYFRRRRSRHDRRFARAMRHSQTREDGEAVGFRHVTGRSTASE